MSVLKTNLNFNLEQFFTQALAKKRDEGSLRQLWQVDRSAFPLCKITTEDGTKYKAISFACNDYLGLSINKKVKAAVAKASKKYGVGSSGSKFIGGYNELCRKLESDIAAFKGLQDCILFSSGYLANLGIFASIFNENDTIFADKQIHASIIDGINLSRAKLVRYSHLNHSHLIQLLEKHASSNKAEGKICIATEAVFSMSGGVDNISALLDIAKKYNAILIVDEAHSFGVLQNTIYKHYDYFIRVGTLSKAAGLCGGYVCCSNLLALYIKNYARSGIYNTSLPPNIIAGACEAVKIISQKTSSANSPAVLMAQYFCKKMSEQIGGTFKADITSHSAIVALNLDNCIKTYTGGKQDGKGGNDVGEVLIDNPALPQNFYKNLSLYLLQNGYFARAILPPTVQKPILRLTFSSLHTEKQVDALCVLIANFAKFFC